MDCRKKIKSHTFRGKRWKIVWRKPPRTTKGDSDADCERPDSTDKTIRINSKAAGLRELELELHEAAHASFWDWDEEAVEEAARDIAKFLWRIGWRRT